jgi:hypothetical protein
MTYPLRVTPQEETPQDETVHAGGAPRGVEPCGLVPAPRRRFTVVGEPERMPRRGAAFRGASRRGGRLLAEGAGVARLHAPLDAGPAAPLRLTHRGVLVLSAAVAVLGAALLLLAARSAPSLGMSGVSSATGRAGSPAALTVRAGDTLWDIAARVAPNADPRAEVAHLVAVNHLSGVVLRPGQRLLLR